MRCSGHTAGNATICSQQRATARPGCAGLVLSVLPQRWRPPSCGINECFTSAGPTTHQCCAVARGGLRGVTCAPVSCVTGPPRGEAERCTPRCLDPLPLQCHSQRLQRRWLYCLMYKSCQWVARRSETTCPGTLAPWRCKLSGWHIGVAVRAHDLHEINWV